MKKIPALTLIFILSSQMDASSAGINPLSKIVITSDRATCQKSPTNPEAFIFNYQDNVCVNFADKSTITASSLEVIFEGKSLGKSLGFDHKKTCTEPQDSSAQTVTTTKDDHLKKFKKIIFTGNVVLSNQNRKTQAQYAELCLTKHLCTLKGNVRIEQKKTTPKDVPISIESDEAQINLLTDELLFSGTINKPVNTVISLEDFEPLKKKHRSKHKKNKRRKSS